MKTKNTDLPRPTSLCHVRKKPYSASRRLVHNVRLDGPAWVPSNYPALYIYKPSLWRVSSDIKKTLSFSFWLVICKQLLEMSEQMSNVFSDVGEGLSSDMLSFSDTVFGFLDENYPLSENSSLDEKEWGEEAEEEEDENCDSYNERKAFWDEQEKLLQGILCRTSSIETKVRNATKDALRELKGTSQCCCLKSVAVEGCKECMRRDISDRLCNAGFSCSLRKSKWRHSSEIPAGEHIYLEVVEKRSANKAEVRIVIELNFRAEFEMAKASQEYNRLIQRLPEVYVGKEDRLRNAIKILCGAAKKCTKERKVHLGPWRKLKYMQAKWLSPYTELILTVAKEPVVVRKANASLFTLPFLDKLPGSNCQPVAVV